MAHISMYLVGPLLPPSCPNPILTFPFLLQIYHLFLICVHSPSLFFSFPLINLTLGCKLLKLKMAVAMASCSVGVNLNSNSSLKRSLAIPAPTEAMAEASFGFAPKSFCTVHKGRLISSSTSITPRAAVEGGKTDGSPSETDTVPIPKVIIDQDSDPDATVVEITFGDRLGALLDTMSALRNLGLNVVKANVYLDSSGKHNKFAITRADTGRKVEDPELLEAIRLTIINNLIEYHPESSSQLAMGAAFGIVPPQEQVDVDIATHVSVNDDGPTRSLLCVESADRPGLLVDLVKIIIDINVAVESGEFDTEGLLAKAKFHVSYRGKPLIKPLQQVLANSLRYYLRRPATEEASF